MGDDILPSAPRIWEHCEALARCSERADALTRVFLSKEQRAGEWDVWQTSLHNPDFAAYAQLCGAHGARVTRIEQLDDALAAAFAHVGPSLVDVVTDPDLI